MNAIAEGFRAQKLEPLVVEFTSTAKNSIDVPADDIQKVLKMLEALEDLDDVQNVYSNANLDDVEE